MLCIVLLIHALPVIGLAEPSGQTQTPETASTTRVKELVERRTENSKHFLMSDGTYQSVTYATSVHYEDCGEWQEIDHSLVQVDGRLETAQSAKPVSFGTDADDTLITIGEGNDTLSFDLIGQVSIYMAKNNHNSLDSHFTLQLLTYANGLDMYSNADSAVALMRKIIGPVAGDDYVKSFEFGQRTEMSHMLMEALLKKKTGFYYR